MPDDDFAGRPYDQQPTVKHKPEHDRLAVNDEPTADQLNHIADFFARDDDDARHVGSIIHHYHDGAFCNVLVVGGRIDNDYIGFQRNHDGTYRIDTVSPPAPRVHDTEHPAAG